MNALIALDKVVARSIELVCITLTAVLFLLVVIAVATRLGGFGSPAWTDEVVEFCLAWLIFIGAVGLWRSQDHFRVDLLDQLSRKPSSRWLLALLVEGLSICFLAILTYHGVTFALSATDTSPTFALSRSLWYAALPVSSGMMLAYSVVRLVRLCHDGQVPADERRPQLSSN
jgi:TRAP-type C4-dicarboxylate transport system permease small subunit